MAPTIRMTSSIKDTPVFIIDPMAYGRSVEEEEGSDDGDDRAIIVDTVLTSCAGLELC